MAEGQRTTLSEQGLFRTGVTLFIGWLLLQGWAMRQGGTERVPRRTPVAV
ncbi:MAG: hypothetical protein ACR2P0_02125 [Acidimicrobiales bacterium]